MNELLEQVIMEAVIEVVLEGRYDSTPNPLNLRGDVRRNLGYNPLYADNGRHSSNDVVSQVSTFDTNGENFRTENHCVVSNNKFMFYKVKNFGTDRIDSTLSLFGSGANGEKELRRAIDTLNGAAMRNGRGVSYKTITSDTFKQASAHSGHLSKTFWEFSFDGGNTWNILKPNPVQDMKQSKVKF